MTFIFAKIRVRTARRTRWLNLARYACCCPGGVQEEDLVRGGPGAGDNTDYVANYHTVGALGKAHEVCSISIAAKNYHFWRNVQDTMKSWIVHPGWTISNRQAGKLWRARSRLYQRQFLQVNSHFSGFFEIYQIHIPSHPCKFKIYSFLNFFSFFAKNSAIFRDFAEFSLFFFENFKEFCRNSGKY